MAEPISCANQREGYNKWLQIATKTIAHSLRGQEKRAKTNAAQHRPLPWTDQGGGSTTRCRPTFQPISGMKFAELLRVDKHIAASAFLYGL
jgi:hypothetical protein